MGVVCARQDRIREMGLHHIHLYRSPDYHLPDSLLHRPRCPLCGLSLITCFSNISNQWHYCYGRSRKAHPGAEKALGLSFGDGL